MWKKIWFELELDQLFPVWFKADFDKDNFDLVSIPN